jgi:hypothetical protein
VKTAIIVTLLTLAGVTLFVLISVAYVLSQMP